MTRKEEIKLRKEEIENELVTLQDALVTDLDADAKTSIGETINALNDELDRLESEEKSIQEPSTPSTSLSQTALATLRAAMMSGSGSGVDSKEVRQIIEQYLKQDKVKLDELDKEVMEFIKANQKVVLELPNFGGLKIEMSKADSDIPYFFDIIDDVLAGNNVYLIGEAGGGKTFSAEQVAKKLKREFVVINCSQYTSPTEILGGQTIEGYKEGKLIDAWKNGKILILDEMPRLDPNTAGLFNDALAKSSKTKKPSDAKISSTNPENPPIERNENFGLIATGNVYPNTPPPPKYKANNQQDLSLLDRFSGSVYKIEYTKAVDEMNTRFKFLYDMLIGNFYDYMLDLKNNKPKPEAKGLRTVLKDLELDDLAVVSYRTLVSFRVAFEFELVREIAKREGKSVQVNQGKTLVKAFDSFLVAFNDETKNTIINKTKFTTSYIQSKVDEAIKKIIDGKMIETLNDKVASSVSSLFKKYQDLFVAETVQQ
jgi:hypothetical protein